jgi:LCP family protein required for cell wall assembly
VSKRRAPAVALALLATVALVRPALAWSLGGRGEPAVTIHKVDEASFVARQPDQPLFLLLIGNDGRAGLEGIRGDAIHLVGINPATHAATILNIPRDTWVDIAGHGKEKITRSMEFGGLQLQVQTIAALTGVHFSFAVTTGFDGFQRLVDEMGGLEVNVTERMYDPYSGADFQPGRTYMAGGAALSYARNRHIPNGDLARTTNQGWLLVAALERARQVSHSPFDTMRLLGLIARNTRVEGVGFRDLFGLVGFGLSIDPANVRNVTMPATIGKVGKADVVFVGPGASDLFADFRDDAMLQSH